MVYIRIKKAQITVFVIVGIVIAAAFAFLFMAMPRFDVEAKTSDPVKAYAENCFSIAAACTLYKLGSNNANIDFSQDFPAIETARRDARTYFQDRAEQCQDFSKFRSAEIEKGPITPKINFNHLDTVFDISQKLKIKQQGSTKTISQFSSRLPVGFRKSYALAEDIRKHELSIIGDEYINADLLEDDTISIKVYENDPYVITITDQGSRLKDEFYRFSFLKPFTRP